MDMVATGGKAVRLLLVMKLQTRAVAKQRVTD
jgi:hypothetical protein